MQILKRYNFSNKWRLKDNLVLVKLISTLIIPAIILVLMVALFASVLYVTDIKQDIDSTSLLVLSNAGITFNNLVEASKQIAYGVYTIPQVKTLFTQSYEKEDLYLAARYLTTLVSSSPQLYSVQIIYDGKLVLSMGGSTLFNENEEELYRTIKGYKNFKPKPRKVINKTGVLELITTVYSEIDTNGIKSYVIVNFKPEILSDTLYDGNLHKEQNLIIADSDGNILASRNDKDFSLNIAQEQYFDAVKKNTPAYGNIKLPDEEANYNIVNYYFLKGREYVALFTGSNDSFYSKLIRAQTAIVICFLLVIFLLVIVAIFITNRIYTPISNIFTNVRTLVGNDYVKKDNIMKESDYISNILSNSMQRLTRLENDRMNNFKNYKNIFIYKLLLSENSMSPQEYRKGIDNYNMIRSLDSIYQIFVLRIDDYKRFAEGDDNGTVNEKLGSLENLAYEHIRNKVFCSTFIVENDNVIMLVSYDEQDSSELERAMLFELLELKSKVADQMNTGLTIGGSDLFERAEMDDIRKYYKQAYSLTNYRLMKGTGLLMRTADVQTEKTDYDKVNKMIEKIADSIKSGDGKEWEEKTAQLLKTVAVYTYEDNINILLLLIESVNGILEEINISANEYGIHQIKEMTQVLKHFESYAEVREWLLNYFSDVSGRIKEIRNNKTVSLINNAIEYISRNYYDSTLTAYRIAEEVGITPQYFSMLFKQQVGVSFPEYTMNLRLSKAKEILNDSPSISMAKLCEMIGYSNASYFTATFTKKIGVSPSKYVLSLRDKKI